jgi:hypothetical protein
MLWIVARIAALLAMVACSGTDPVQAAPEAFSPVKADCTTGPTHFDGSRQDITCQQCYAATKGYVIVQNATGSRIVGGFNERTCSTSFSDFVEVLPGSGITQPTKACTIGFARSPGGMGNAGARASVECELSGQISRLP